MVKARTIAFGVAVVAIGIWAAVHFFPGEEKKVRKQFDLLARWVSKGRGEGTLTAAQRVWKIRSLFAENCEVTIPEYSLSGSYTPQEVSGYAASARLEFSTVALRFNDMEIEFPEEGTAKVMLTGKVTGTTRMGEYVNETRELECVLRKKDSKWRFSRFGTVEVLRK